ncbi:hypothetical protein IMSAG025_00970 [Muribaculaceae bacterium]|nr:hypothetical protein IMSAG025_00970 [Muribaculaceae bacterium]
MNIQPERARMKRIFPDVIEVYKQFGSSNPLDEFLEDKIYQEYVNRLLFLNIVNVFQVVTESDTAFL